MTSTVKAVWLLALGACASYALAVQAGEAGIETRGDSRYIRLDKVGKPAGETQARCVRDGATSLVWELKTDDGGIHDKDNTYRWGGLGAEKASTAIEGGSNKDIRFDDWNTLVAGANQEALCGFQDWRVPTIDELKSLVNSSNKPTIDGKYFPLTLPAPYWSASSFPKRPEHGQNVHFGNGTSYYFNGYRGNALSLRLVRGKVVQTKR